MNSLKQLIQWTRIHRASIVEKARSISVRFLDSKWGYDDDGDRYNEVTAICQADTIPRKVLFKFYGSPDNPKVWCSCSCEYWLYHCEVAMEAGGNTDVIHSNGAKPNYTNPAMIRHCCKHQIACIMRGAHKMKPKGRPPKEKKG